MECRTNEGFQDRHLAPVSLLSFLSKIFHAKSYYRVCFYRDTNMFTDDCYENCTPEGEEMILFVYLLYLEPALGLHSSLFTPGIQNIVVVVLKNHLLKTTQNLKERSSTFKSTVCLRGILKACLIYLKDNEFLKS